MEGVLMSLKEWNGEIEPLAVLEEVWVQVRGIPPKWIDWLTLRQVGSTLGKLVEVDWNSLITSYGEMVRIRIKCKNPARIPSKRVFELEEKLYLIHLKPENVCVESSEKGDNDEDDDNGGDDDPVFEDMEEEQGGHHNTSPPKDDSKSKRKGVEGDHSSKGSDRKNGSKTVQIWASLFNDNVLEEAGMAGEYSSRNLLREMELVSSDNEADNEINEHEVDDLEMSTLPAEWIDLGIGDNLQEIQVATENGLPIAPFQETVEVVETAEDKGKAVAIEPEGTNKKFKCEQEGQGKTSKKWGPTLVEGRPRRQKQDGRSMLERAKELKEKQNLEKPKSKKSSNPFDILSEVEIKNVASVLGVNLGKTASSICATVDEIQSSDADRNKTITDSCLLTNNFFSLDANVDGKVVCPISLKMKSQGVDPAAKSFKNNDQWDQCEIKSGSMEWTIVSNRKSHKKVNNDRCLLEH